MEEKFYKCDLEEFDLFVGIARKIWFCRNSMVHGGDFIHPNILLQCPIESNAEFRRANSKEAGRIAEGRDENLFRWNPPP